MPDERTMPQGNEHPTNDSSPSAHNVAPARITLLYESRDKRFCLFEDAQGHLAAVNAARLA